MRDILTRLVDRVDDLERRVAALERKEEGHIPEMELPGMWNRSDFEGGSDAE